MGNSSVKIIRLNHFVKAKSRVIQTQEA